LVKDQVSIELISSNHCLDGIEKLGCRTSQEILSGVNPKNDRSNSLTTAFNEWCSWVHWTAQNGITISGNPEELAHHAGQQLGLDSDRINRILKSVGGDVSLEPAALRRGGEEACWKKIYKLDKATFDAKCPTHIKDAILRDWKINRSSSSSSAAHTGGKNDSTQDRGAVALLEKEPEQQTNTLNSKAPHQKINDGSTLGGSTFRGSGGGGDWGNGDGAAGGSSQPPNQWNAPTSWNG
jgi:hypothetical protein